MAETPRIIVLGIGNLLKGDDGVGVRIIEALNRRALPEGVECVDGGTGGPTLVTCFEGAAALVIVDAVNLRAPPGTVRAFSLEEVEAGASRAPFSLHEVGILPMLELARELNRLPPVVRIVGVQPQRFDGGDRLSAAVEAAVPEAVTLVVSEIDRLAGGA